jgi:hypothetical protein
MRILHIGSLSLAAVAFVTFPAVATAQEKRFPVLNSLEVQQLVERAEPGDSARLAAHFNALADQHSAEAERHSSMAQGFVGNPSRNVGAGMSAHCKRLSALNTATAAVLQELSDYHNRLASGAPALRPSAGARFEGGAGASAPTVRDLEDLAAKAGTRAEHLALHEYFLTLANRYAGEARQHSAFAAGVRNTRIEQAAGIHERLASVSQDAAAEARAAAEMHKQLANIGR